MNAKEVQLTLHMYPPGRGDIDVAREYREQESSWDGYVIVFAGEVTGWSRALDRPRSWRPGCIAVDVDGSRWEAVGGSDYAGARTWKPLQG